MNLKLCSIGLCLLVLASEFQVGESWGWAKRAWNKVKTVGKKVLKTVDNVAGKVCGVVDHIGDMKLEDLKQMRKENWDQYENEMQEFYDFIEKTEGRQVADAKITKLDEHVERALVESLEMTKEDAAHALIFN